MWREAGARWQYHDADDTSDESRGADPNGMSSTDPNRNHDADHTADPIPPPGRTARPIPPFLPPEGVDKEEGDADDGGVPAAGPGPKEAETNAMSAGFWIFPDDSSADEAVAIGPLPPPCW